KVTTSCMYASFTPCLTSAVSRAPEARVALRLLPAMRLGASRGAPQSLRERPTDPHRLLPQCHHRLHGSLRRQGDPEVVAPDQCSRHAAHVRPRSGAAGPDRTAFSTDSSARSGNSRRPERRGQKMTNATRTTKSARGWLPCGAATATTQNVVSVWWLSALTLVFGLLAAAPVRAVC